MSVFTESVKKVVRGAMDSFRTFPASVGSAAAFAIVTAVRIHMDWPEQEAYNFLFNCLHWALALGAVFGLASVTWARSRYGDKRKLVIVNLAALAAVAVSFPLLYFFGGYKLFPTDQYQILRGIAVSRMTAAIFVSLVAFVVFGALPRKKPDFSASLFMTQKAFFVAAIYGGVIMAGLSSVAGAFQALLYSGMSYKVYQYLGAAVGLAAFAIFAGYFPDFGREEADEKRISAQTQPKFVETMFSYIMVPIVMALTLVFLVWTGKTVFEGVGANFLRLSGIATSYAVAGIWLHMMVTDHKSGIARLYRRLYPFAAMVILSFEAWALVDQLSRSGMKTAEYSFLLVWVFAVISVVLLAVRKERSHVAIACIASIAVAVSVLPLVGYHRLPPSMQVGRLEKLLDEQGMLEGGAIKPAKTEPPEDIREGITDAVTYLAYQRDARLPDWFDRELSDPNVFREKLGFEQDWPDYEPQDSEYKGIYLTLEPTVIDLDRYDWAVNLQDYTGKGEVSAEIAGTRGKYKIYWTTDYKTRTSASELRVLLDDRLIIQQSMDGYIEGIAEKYLSDGVNDVKSPGLASLEDMSLSLESPEADVMLVFSSVDVQIDPNSADPYYSLQVSSAYIDEK